MTAIHDMGGVPGYGPVRPEQNEPVFHSEWEGRVFGLATTVRGGLSRRRLEALDPDTYLSGYYQRWLAALENGLTERGVLTREDIDAKADHFRHNPGASPTRVVDPALAGRVREGMYRQRREHKTPPGPPAFAVGDCVRARFIRHEGHTRLPRYVQGKRGTVTAVYAAYDLQDDVPPGEDVPVQQLYSVRFEGGELWGESAEPGAALYIDMWEGYLEPDNDQVQRSAP